MPKVKRHEIKVLSTLNELLSAIEIANKTGLDHIRVFWVLTKLYSEKKVKEHKKKVVDGIRRKTFVSNQNICLN
jgi:DNA-binding transcriptional regulator GbsR (MarR family)